MNKIFEELKEKCKSTLKETSKDESEKGKIGFLTDLEKECINFDKLKEEYIKQNKITCDFPSSVDALLEFNSELYLIEFKNMTYENIENNKKMIFEIKKKVYESLLILLDLIDRTISFSRKNITFILVYKTTNPYEIYKGIKNKLSGNDLKLLNFKNIDKLYFKNVHTLTSKLFDDFVKKLERTNY